MNLAFITIFTDIFFHTRFAAIRTAFCTGIDAVRTNGLIAYWTPYRTSRADGFITTPAVGGTFLAIVMLAVIAEVTVITCTYIATVVAGYAFPF